MITMYIQYAKNDKNQLVIACYHEKIQSISAAIALARKFAIPVEALQKREVLIANLVKDEPILKSYPSSVKENKQPSFFNSAVKAPVNSPGGEDGCYTLC